MEVPTITKMKYIKIAYYLLSFGAVVAVLSWQLTHHPTREEMFKSQKEDTLDKRPSKGYNGVHPLLAH